MAVLLARVCIGFHMLSNKLLLSAGADNLGSESILGGCCTDDVVFLPGMSLSTFAACIRSTSVIRIPTSYALYIKLSILVCLIRKIRIFRMERLSGNCKFKLEHVKHLKAVEIRQCWYCVSTTSHKAQQALLLHLSAGLLAASCLLIFASLSVFRGARLSSQGCASAAACSQISQTVSLIEVELARYPEKYCSIPWWSAEVYLLYGFLCSFRYSSWFCYPLYSGLDLLEFASAVYKH